MQAFTQYTPTEIIFGRGAENKTGELVKKYKGTKVLVVYGGKSAVSSGLIQRIANQLKNENIGYILFGGAKPNPGLSLVNEGIKIAIDNKIDFILAVGGGSAIDTGKVIAWGALVPGLDVWKFFLKEAEAEKALPVGTVLTISAAGSETSNSAVITNEQTGEKRGLTAELNRPCFAVMDPELTYTLPKFQVSCGIADIMMHTLERYFTNTEGNELTDEIAAALLRVVIRNGEKLLLDSHNYDAASEIMWAGSLSHNGLTGLGRPMDFSVHQFGHELSAKFDVAHGAALTAMWGSWAKYCCHKDYARFAKYAVDVWGVDMKNAQNTAFAGIDKTVGYFRQINMPACFTELGIGILNSEEINELADRCVFRGKRKIGNFYPLDKQDVINVYNMANR